MAMSALLSIPGIQGSAPQKGAGGKMVVLAVDFDVAAEVALKDGRPNADALRFTRIAITKEVDAATPALAAALDKKKRWDAIELEFYRMPPGGGGLEKHYTIHLAGVRILGIGFTMHDNAWKENAALPEEEELTLSCEGMSCAWTAGLQDGGDAAEQVVSAALLGTFQLPIENHLEDWFLKQMAEWGKEMATMIGTGLAAAHLRQVLPPGGASGEAPNAK
jgi:type VI secretion system Hcp family effector